MHTVGKIGRVGLTLDGSLALELHLPNDEKTRGEVENLPGGYLDIDVKKLREKRSVNANDYFWVLADKIAKKIGSDKYTVYLMELSKYGAFVDYFVKNEVIDKIRALFRYSEVLNEYEAEDGLYSKVRGYIGSSEYDSKEMSELIEGTVRDARELGIDTATPEEIAELLSVWGTDKNSVRAVNGTVYGGY